MQLCCLKRTDTAQPIIDIIGFICLFNIRTFSPLVKLTPVSAKMSGNN